MVVHLWHVSTVSEERGKTVGRKWLEKKGERPLASDVECTVTVDHAHCKKKAAQGTEDVVQTCWLASIV